MADAAVNGYCLGGGFEIALVCDLRIASTEARFGLPEITLGFFPLAGAPMRLPRAIPQAVRLGSTLRWVVGQTADAKEGPRAFAEKRTPQFRGE